MDNHYDLKLGVIGSGGRGGLASHAHKPGEGSRIVACCDLKSFILEENRQNYGSDIFVTQDYHELLEQDLDAVFITTPDYMHEEQALAALRAGKAIYLEKPMAITTEGCDRILRTAYETGTKLYLGHNMRHMPFVQKMKSLIDEGAIGEVKTVWARHFVGHGGDYYFKDWHAESRYSTSLLLQKAAHDLDILHWLCGGYAELVNALGDLMVYGDIDARREPQNGPASRPYPNAQEGFFWPPAQQRWLNANIDVEDVSMLQMRLNNGVLAAYQQCHFTPDYWRSYTVIGTEGRIENFGNGETGTHIKLWNRRKQDSAPPDEVYMIHEAEGGHGGADPNIVNEFLRYVREGGAVQTSAIAARYSVAAGCAATQSLRSGGVPVEIAPVESEVAEYFEGERALVSAV